jgi:uncharacterized protein (DUF927 family)
MWLEVLNNWVANLQYLFSVSNARNIQVSMEKYLLFTIRTIHTDRVCEKNKEIFSVKTGDKYSKHGALRGSFSEFH